MGKSKRQLEKERKKIYNEEIYITSQENIEEKQNDIKETTILIQKELLRFCNENSWPLCEYLDLQNIENFVEWLLIYG